jgi:uncharacterized SAM-dependent methyltransferase
VHALQSKECVLIDESIAFLRQIAETESLGKNIKIRPVVDDFFENDTAYLEEQALVCSFGSTISNIINPISGTLPQEALVGSLSKLAHAANKGWMLVGFDSDQDGDRIKDYFRKHALFQLNVFDRMACELPIAGDFDPKAFSYEPEWIASSGQLAHVAIVNKDMQFNIGGTDISLRENQRLHIKNSYKFTTGFFEDCCRAAGLDVVRNWSNNSCAKVYLLKIQPRHNLLRPAILVKQDVGEVLQVA